MKTLNGIVPGLFFFGLLIPGHLWSQPDSTDQEIKSSTTIENQLDQLFEYCKNNSQFSGSVLIARHSNIIYKKSFGLADIEAGIPNTPKTNFNVASTTKPFTALAIALLVENSKIEYDVPVTRYLQEFPYASITLRQLLTHTSGLPNYSHRPPFIKYHDAVSPITSPEKVFTSRDILDWLIEKDAKLAFEPGSKMSYCNTGYVILSLIIEKASGKSYDEFIKEHILIPAGMNNSLIYSKASDPPIPNRAFGYRPTLDRTSFVMNDMNCLDGIVGEGGLYTSVEDLFRFDQALYSYQLMSKETSAQMFSPCVLNDGQKKGYGLGWIIAGYDDQGPLIVKHGGKWRGFTTAFQRLIEDSSTVIILTNCGLSGPTIGSIRDAATNILLHQDLKFPKFPIADKIAEVLFAEGADSAVALFHLLQKNATDRYFFEEYHLNILGYNLMYENRLEDALKILEANADTYPESANVYDSLGDVYKAGGDTLKAIEQYRKALSIDPELDHTLKKLKELSGSGGSEKNSNHHY